MKKPKPRTWDSLRAAAKGMGLPLGELQRAKDGGCEGFRSNRVYETEVIDWLSENPRTPGDTYDPKEEKLREEIRKLRIANDAKEGRLVERAWVAERIQRAAGELHAFRAKSEMEHPMRFAAAAGDVPMCRTVLRGVWDEVFKGIQSLEKHFSE